MALGASPSSILRLVVRQGMSAVLLGIAAGLAGALALTRLLGSLIYGVGAHDPLRGSPRRGERDAESQAPACRRPSRVEPLGDAPEVAAAGRFRHSERQIALRPDRRTKKGWLIPHRRKGAMASALRRGS
jgi:hypothetical protein